MKYGMINTLRQQYPVALMCRVLDVSESGFMPGILARLVSVKRKIHG